MSDQASERQKPDAQARRQPRKVTAKSLENAALHYLNRYATSSANLRRVLHNRVRRAARAHDSDESEGKALVEDLLTRLQQYGLLDDQAYAAARALSLHKRGTGAAIIRAKLRQKGVASDDIDQALAQLQSAAGDSAMRAALAYARRRRLGPFRAADQRDAFRQRDLAALARQGHSPNLVLRIIDCQDLAELELEAGED